MAHDECFLPLLLHRPLTTTW